MQGLCIILKSGLALQKALSTRVTDCKGVPNFWEWLRDYMKNVHSSPEERNMIILNVTIVVDVFRCPRHEETIALEGPDMVRLGKNARRAKPMLGGHKSVEQPSSGRIV